MLRHCVLPFCLLALTLPGPALAESQRRYDVELIIFENMDTSAGERERWHPRVTVPMVEGAILLDRLAGPGTAAETQASANPADENEDAAAAVPARAARAVEVPEGFEPLPPERTRLGGARTRLEESDRYRVLRHLAWRQPALDDEAAVPVRAYRGEALTVRVPIKDFEELYALEQAASGDEDSGETDTEGADGEQRERADTGAANGTERAPGSSGTALAGTGGAQTFGTGPMFQTNVRPLLRPVEVHPLDGTVRVVVSRYLHVYTDLYFTTPVQWTALPQGNADRQESAEDAASDTEQAELRGSGGGISAPQVALGPDGNAMLSYPFVQHRRMRSGELHYLDHPVLGMLIVVDRAPEPGEEAATDDGGQAAGG